jgi:hypothetical protein
VAILFFAVVASHPDPDGPVLRASTAKSLNEFGSCFTREQDEAARPWAFMPAARGGTFTNSGASGADAPYWLIFSEAKSSNQVRLFAAANSGDVIEAANRCS